MKLTEEQINAIIADLKEQLQDRIDDPDTENAEPYEDEYGHCYSTGSHTDEGEFEEICLNGLPGFKADEVEVVLTCEYGVECNLYFEPYDCGDYWTEPSGGGVDVNESEGSIFNLDGYIHAYNAETDDWEELEIPEGTFERIMEEVNNGVKQNLRPSTIKRRKEYAEKVAKYKAECEARKAALEAQAI